MFGIAVFSQQAEFGLLADVFLVDCQANLVQSLGQQVLVEGALHSLLQDSLNFFSELSHQLFEFFFFYTQIIILISFVL